MLSPTSPLRDRLLERINTRYDLFLAGGYPLADYAPETIQCRNELDRTNWIELRDMCRQAVADERAFYGAMETPLPDVIGDYPIPAPGIRCTSNAYIVPTVAETLSMLDLMRDWAKAAQENWWVLKDAARTAPTREALASIDLGEGWP